MDTPKKVLLVGDSALMAVTEAALSAYAEMEVKRIAELRAEHLECDVIVVDRCLAEECFLALACANPGVVIFELNWDAVTFTTILVKKNITLDIEHLSAFIFGQSGRI